MKKFEDDSLPLNETCSDTKFHVYNYIGTTDIELCEFKEKKKNNNMDKIKFMFSSNMKRSGILVKYFIHNFVLTFSML